MPGFNRTGPEGLGPMTGRGMGPCGDGTPRGRGFYGRGFGRGRGFSRGFGRGYFQGNAAPVVDDKAYLQERIKFLEEELQRLKEIQEQE